MFENLIDMIVNYQSTGGDSQHEIQNTKKNQRCEALSLTSNITKMKTKTKKKNKQKKVGNSSAAKYNLETKQNRKAKQNLSW